MFACLESNIPHKYTFNENTQLLVLDVENNSREFVDNIHPLVLATLNNTHHLTHGQILQDYLSNKLDEQISSYDNLEQELAKKQEEEKEVEEEKVVVEEEKEVEEKIVEEKPKKKRGRPKKVVEEKPKKKRGRPKQGVE